MSSVRAERLAANIDGDFVVFLIGMRINSLVRVDRWLPVATAMPRMLKELQRRPELGLLHYEIWGGRTTLVLQYWRSIEQLLAYNTIVVLLGVSCRSNLVLSLFTNVVNPMVMLLW